MTTQNLILAAIVLAFSSLGVTLFVVAWWSNLTPPAKPAAVVARRPKPGFESTKAVRP